MSGLSLSAERQESDSRLSQLLAGILFVLFLACILLFGISQLTPVPDVTGLTVEQAEAKLEKAGFELGSEREQAADPSQDGKILEQAPSVGTRVLAGSAISVVVANSLVATSEEEVEEAGTSPSAGTTLPVWTGNPPRTPTIVPYQSAADPAGFRVPAVIGMTQSQAVAALSAEGFNVAVTTGKSTTGVPSGLVFAQKPGVESYVASRGTVTIYISTGAPAVSPYPKGAYSN